MIDFYRESVLPKMKDATLKASMADLKLTDSQNYLTDNLIPKYQLQLGGVKNLEAIAQEWLEFGKLIQTDHEKIKNESFKIKTESTKSINENIAILRLGMQ